MARQADGSLAEFTMNPLDGTHGSDCGDGAPGARQRQAAYQNLTSKLYRRASRLYTGAVSSAPSSLAAARVKCSIQW